MTPFKSWNETDATQDSLRHYRRARASIYPRAVRDRIGKIRPTNGAKNCEGLPRGKRFLHFQGVLRQSQSHFGEIVSRNRRSRRVRNPRFHRPRTENSRNDGRAFPIRGDNGGPIHRFAANPSLPLDRKSTRLNSSHTVISYAVFCLKK